MRHSISQLFKNRTKAFKRFQSLAHAARRCALFSKSSKVSAITKARLTEYSVFKQRRVQTKNAVTAFQRNCGITADGIAGPKTLKYLGLGSSSSASASSGKYSSNDVTLLAKLIAAEARGESYTGQVAVGAVVLNRVKHSSFPDTISGVIYQKGAFSAVNDSNWSIAPSETSRKAAQDCINGWDPSGGAIYYYNPKKTSNSFMLSRPVVKTIGNHVFCK